ncbi:FAD-binding oxidoreductase [Kribbella sp. NPDC051770]|uniref:FAD-binding oxidoreductase n=1 Tax=Kribbella sp. NPDC051770 TaxID=3155413 RepID=UPI00343F4FC0
MLTSVAGPVLVPGDAGYADELSFFNLSVGHQPQVVVGATSAADVQAAIRHSHDVRRPVAVLNTGHGPSVSTPADAVAITTRRMTGLTIDAERRTARAEAGVRWGQVVEEAAEAGLAPLAGSSPTVGVVGYTLGGGVSIAMARKFGYAADHVRRIELVTADAELRTVDATSEPDLFFALCGGKGNFGVVTAIEFDLFPVTDLYAGALLYAGADARDVLTAYRRFTATAPDEVTSSVLLLRAPDLPFVPEVMRGKLTVSVRLAYVGTADDGAALVAPLRAAAPVLMDTVAPMPAAEIAGITNDPTEPGAAVEHFAVLDELGADTVDAVLDVVGPDAETAITMVNLSHLGGALGRAPRVPNAVRRDIGFAVFALTAVAPDQVEAQRDAGRELIDRLATGRRHPGYLAPADASVDAVRTAYDEATYQRLQEVKTKYDPANVFRFNHNIPPLG